jgi:cell fate (sporulation/competence/biofilm development) regulator YlbF (YheA/YmcA/DUF963 family)
MALTIIGVTYVTAEGTTTTKRSAGSRDREARLMNALETGRAGAKDLFQYTADSPSVRMISEDANKIRQLIRRHPQMKVFRGFRSIEDGTMSDEEAKATFARTIKALSTDFADTIKEASDPDAVTNSMLDILEEDTMSEDLQNYLNNGDKASFRKIRDEVGRKTFAAVDLSEFDELSSYENMQSYKDKVRSNKVLSQIIDSDPEIARVFDNPREIITSQLPEEIKSMF